MRFYKFYPKYLYNFEYMRFDGLYCDYCEEFIKFFADTGAVGDGKGFWDCKECYEDQNIGGWDVCYDCMMNGRDFDRPKAKKC